MAANGLQNGPNSNVACWQLAIKIFNNKLTKDPKKRLTISAASTNQSLMSYRDLLKAAQDARSLDHVNQSAFRGNMENFLLIVNQYAAAIDVLIQQQPDITAVVWGCMRGMMMVAVKEVQLSEEIGNALVKIGRELGRWERVLQLFPSSRRLHETAAELFAQLVNYLVRASRYYQMRHVARLAKAGVTPAQSKLRSILGEIDTLSSQFERESFLASTEALTDDRKGKTKSLKVKRHDPRKRLLTRRAAIEAQGQVNRLEAIEQERFREESRQYMSNGSTKRLQIQNDLASLRGTIMNDAAVREIREKARLAESQRRSALQWLRFAADTSALPATWEDNTCKWIFDHSSYELWKAEGAKNILWVYGIPGCGKSVLASYLSRNMHTQMTLSHFFSKSVDGRSTRPASLAASLFAQLLQNPSAVDDRLLQDMLTGIIPLTHTFSSWENCPFVRLWAILEASLPSLPLFTVIVDGLDECQTNDNCAEILRRLRAIATLPNGNVIVTSRPSDDLRQNMPESVELAMDADTVRDDILHYVEEETRRDPRLRSIGPQILARTEKSAGGMFLWARMMLAYVTSAPTSRIQLERLQRFPNGLLHIYDSFLAESVSILDPEELELQKSIFMLLVASARPLSPEEVSVALALQPAASHPDQQDLLLEPSREIQRLCWPLVTTKGEYASLTHASVAEYFTMPQSPISTRGVHFSMSECQSLVARKCLFRMLHVDLASVGLIEPLMRNNVETTATLPDPFSSSIWIFLSYAYQYWHTHLTQTPADAEFESRIVHFLESRQFITWFETLSLASDHFGPILIIRASLKAWHISTQNGLREQLSKDEFFVKPYTELYQSSTAQDHLSSLSCLALHRLASYYHETGASPKGKSMLQLRTEIVNGFRQTLGCTHRVTLRCETSRAVQLLAARRFSEAQSSLLQNAMLELRHHGDTVADSFVSRSWAAHAMLVQCRYGEAEQHLTVACEGLVRTAGKDSRDSIKAHLWLGWTLEAQGHHRRALELYKNVWELWKRPWGTDNATSVYCQCSIGIVLRKLHEYESSEKHLLDVLSKRTTMFGKDHWLTIDTAINVAILYFETNRLEEAEIHLVTFDTENSDEIMLERNRQIKHMRALLAIRRNRHEEAEEVLKAELDSATPGPGDSSAERVWMTVTLADLLRRRGDSNTAISRFSHLAVHLDDQEQQIHGPCTSADLETVELAAREAKRKQFIKASAILRAHGLAWRKEDLFWSVDDVSAETPQLDRSNI